MHGYKIFHLYTCCKTHSLYSNAVYHFFFFLQCLRDNVELLCNAAEMFYNGGDYNNAKSFFQRVIDSFQYINIQLDSED